MKNSYSFFIWCLVGCFLIINCNIPQNKNYCQNSFKYLDSLERYYYQRDDTVKFIKFKNLFIKTKCFQSGLTSENIDAIAPRLKRMKLYDELYEMYDRSYGNIDKDLIEFSKSYLTYLSEKHKKGKDTTRYLNDFLYVIDSILYHRFFPESKEKDSLSDEFKELIFYHLVVKKRLEGNKYNTANDTLFQQLNLSEQEKNFFKENLKDAEEVLFGNK